MVRGLCAVLVAGFVLSIAAAVQAQPGQVPRPPVYQPAQPQQAVPTQLTMREQDILAKGTISTAEHVIGVAGGLFFGFGLGHAVQGRYGERGFLFMLGEFATMAVALGGFISCITGECNDTYLLVGFGGFLVLRVWEIIDLIVVPPGYNERYWRVHSKVYGRPAPRWGAVVVPTDSGGVASISVRF